MSELTPLPRPKDFINPEDFELPEDFPKFSEEEKESLKTAGFGALMPYHFARFRHEQIENVVIRSKIFLRKRERHILLTWFLRVYKANDGEIVSDASRIRPFPTVQAALDWLGAFAGERNFPFPQPDLTPACENASPADHN